MRTYVRWSPKETATLLRLRRGGASFTSIGAELGRTGLASESRFRFLNMETDELRRRAERARVHRRAERKDMRRGPSAPVNRVIEIMTPDRDALADRERRYLLSPASLTAARFGDPLPGYSALDRR